jgi:hypothetical protein
MCLSPSLLLLNASNECIVYGCGAVCCMGLNNSAEPQINILLKLINNNLQLKNGFKQHVAHIKWILPKIFWDFAGKQRSIFHLCDLLRHESEWLFKSGRVLLRRSGAGAGAGGKCWDWPTKWMLAPERECASRKGTRQAHTSDAHPTSHYTTIILSVLVNRRTLYTEHKDKERDGGCRP